MWYAIGGFGALLYLVLIVTLGVATIRNGHWVLFILGISRLVWRGIRT